MGAREGTRGPAWGNVDPMAIRPKRGFSGAKLLALRVDLGLTQQQLSDRTAARRRIDRADISKYETGDVGPSPLTVGTLAFALGCAVSDLLDTEQVGAA